MNNISTSILLVDANNTVPGEYIEGLQAKDFEVNIVQSGNDAISALRLPDSDENGKTAIVQTPGIVIVCDGLIDIPLTELCLKIKLYFPESRIVQIYQNETEDLNSRIMATLPDDFMVGTPSAQEFVTRLEQIRIRQLYSSRNIQSNSSEQVPTNGFKLPHIGDTIGEFTIVDTIGFGKLSVLYKVIEPKTSKVFAVKLLSKHALSLKNAVEHFMREIDIMSCIDHPNIIHFYKHGIHENCPYIVMDFINGINLEEFLMARGFPSMDAILKVALEIASALECIHSNGLFHRDIKLSNILISNKSQKAILLDFGIARDLEDSDSDDKFDLIQGTPIYMAPELLRGYEASVQSDIYSFGVTLYHFITATPPFVVKSSTKMSLEDFDKRPPLIRMIRPEIHHELENLIIERCMAKSPFSRPQSIREVILKLEEIARRYESEKSSVSSSVKVLFVDDDTLALDTFKALLKKEPYEILTARNGMEALQILSEEKIKVMISDYRMPKMNGVELAERVQQEWPNIIKIILSGASDKETVISAINKGKIYKFMTKSWYRDDMKLTIRQALEQYNLAENNRLLNNTVRQQNEALKELNAKLEKMVNQNAPNTLT
jgi:serine/threonine protein kinase